MWAVREAVMVKLSLDIDDVICDFTRGFFFAVGLSREEANANWARPRDYYYSNILPQTGQDARESFHNTFDALKVKRDFWLGLPVLDHYVPKQVQMYLTARECPDDVTQEWLSARGFPRLPLVNVHPTKRSKASVALEAGMQGHVDDKDDTFLECLSVLPHSFLASRPWNIDVVTPRRIYRLEELDWRI
jgi:hypothetical protein